MPIHFYDSASPESIPSGVYAAVYINGSFAWQPSEIQRMSRVFRVSVEREASFALLARCIDIESGAALPADAVPFIKTRLSHGFDDGTVYVNRSNVEEVAALLRHAGLTARLWLATLDGTQDFPGAWAVQYQGGMTAAYDLSVLRGKNDFHHPTLTN